ncbi:MAG: GNAT family N-acetyltransferase [Pseudobdellovibrio sp.]
MSVSVQLIPQELAKSLIYDIACIRIKVFREFPYSYDGSVEYEVQYLGRYFKSKNAKFITAKDESSGKIVGVATVIPLIEEETFVQKPFLDVGMDLQKICYFGESVLLPEYRGQGIGHKFFNERERYALSLPHINVTTFCAVKRPENHPLRPSHYKPLDAFWKTRGYQKQESLVTSLNGKM